MGGMVAAIEQGFPQREIAESAYRFQQAVERKEQVIVGVNEFVAADEPPVSILYIDDSATQRQMARLAEVKARRDPGEVARALDAMRLAARGTDNLMPSILEAVRAYATLGEMCDALQRSLGRVGGAGRSSEHHDGRVARAVERKSRKRFVSPIALRARAFVIVQNYADVRRFASSSPSRGSTGTTAAPR